MMDQALFERVTYPGNKSNGSFILLRGMATEARGKAEAALAAALVRPIALELADALEGALTKARDAAAGPEAAVTDAKKALAKEQQTVAGRLAAFWQLKRRADANDREREPERDTPEVRELRAALAAAEAEAFPLAQEVRYREEQINGLRAAPSPDPAVLAVLYATMKEASDVE